MLDELSDWVTDLLASLAVNEPPMQAVLLTGASFGTRAQLNAHELLVKGPDGRVCLSELGNRVADAAAEHRRRHGSSPEWAESVADADRWLNE